MERMGLWLHPSPSSFLESRSKLLAPGRFLEVSNDLELNQSKQRRRRRRVSKIGAAGLTRSSQSIEAADYQAGPARQIKNAVAALEDAFNQVSTSGPDGSEEGFAKRGDRVSRKRTDRATGGSSSTPSNGGDLWSDESEELIRSSFGVKPVDWRNLHHRYLTSQEEIELVELLTPVKHLHQVRSELRRVLRREPSDDEWATTANTDFRTLRRRLQLGEAAQNKLIEHNCRLVLFLARRYERDAGSFSLEDLCQEGVKGLIDAMDHFNPGKGTRFSTYAIFWIRTAIVRAITRTGQVIRLPFSFAAKKVEIRKARRELRVELGRNPSDEEVMERTGLDPVQFWNIYYYSNFRVRSLNETVRGTDEEFLEYLPETGDIVSESSEVREEIVTALQRLKDKERMVLQHRYGLEDGALAVKSLREVGRRLNMSQEMVRRYEASALERLRHQEEAKSLRSCLASM
ncbi:hypothetical protein SELMODRAFT_147096 [Selaginella moellendorffii]|uniref:RNA polymerase sigma-70 domain-containing protein n=1 Tax=Selaginella moellendorffii TaxID=88036 RepID=D8RGX1_SELML|nr:uncharacterized protein LOC9632444 [Selaginella moellendorffii]EFJ28664.1 hypothetical protein SELMODRAFT_147096 [Selaginella moellendorffii]|eukprot:XP_002970534.1 uncharacterized protein LOC9632444 [Selaginella moellendorffii]